MYWKHLAIKSIVLLFFQAKDPQNRVQENKYKKKFIFFPLKFGSAVINTKS